MMTKSAPTFLTVALLTGACGYRGATTESSSHIAGAPHEFDAACGLQTDTSFVIYDAKGLLRGVASGAVGMNCTQGPRGSDPAKHAGSKEWACTEARGGDGRFLVDVVSTGQGYVAQVSQEQMFPLPAKVLFVLRCQ